ncbi:CBS domain-containing protein [Agrobacterium rosae]|uniref:CBS domain-containing protein n=1 Tax=Agrobacterium rosae TaxID=1972867 RepID=A0AAE5RZD9_9HYPH|nr:CBS domain-containing protein [Agrobacterium rosae]KAA3512201.1 CBS domain-containing protein [Agrobacterium rosae]KAA3520350.1 CBS domain-containing protein [Agrobacterium rosae]MCM2432232.1 CBS domain-containing protein [Agrobacterium rosae]MDX8327628.1 CBS domain-containing protein [Agrobacterium rosae]MQB48813.1 CBS domain-containing protein [Agrobacterium rosae]
MAIFVKELLDLKGREVVTVRPDLSLGDAAITLHEHRIGAVVVTDDAGAILGIFTERDMVKAIAAHASAALQTKVSDVMTKNVTRCHEGSSTDDLMELMTGGRFRHLPVEAGGRLVGIISIGDVVKARISEIEAEAEHIKAYIAG